MIKSTIIAIIRAYDEESSVPQLNGNFGEGAELSISYLRQHTRVQDGDYFPAKDYIYKSQKPEKQQPFYKTRSKLKYSIRSRTDTSLYHGHNNSKFFYKNQLYKLLISNVDTKFCAIETKD